MGETIRGNDITTTGPTPIDKERQMASVSNQCSTVAASPGGVSMGGTVINPILPAPFAPPASWIGVRGSNWIRGLEYTSTLNGYLTPNSSTPDYTAHGRTWSAARSFHPGGVQVGLADGSVRFIRETISPTIWRALWTRAGGETVSNF
jgi:prepilin-type processing-associated H-X9-DG protein